MKAGRLDRRLTVLRRSLTNGQWNPEETWSAVATVWARKQHGGEDERYAADERYAERVVTFETRYFANVVETDRLRCDGQEFDILGIREIGRREGLEFKAKASDPEPMP